MAPEKLLIEEDENNNNNNNNARKKVPYDSKCEIYRYDDHVIYSLIHEKLNLKFK